MYTVYDTDTVAIFIRRLHLVLGVLWVFFFCMPTFCSLECKGCRCQVQDANDKLANAMTSTGLSPIGPVQSGPGTFYYLLKLIWCLYTLTQLWISECSVRSVGLGQSMPWVQNHFCNIFFWIVTNSSELQPFQNSKIKTLTNPGYVKICSL